MISEGKRHIRLNKETKMIEVFSVKKVLDSDGKVIGDHANLSLFTREEVLEMKDLFDRFDQGE